MFVNVNPVRLSLDYMTVVWLNAFSLNLLHSLDLPESTVPKIHTDMRIDALMPRVSSPIDMVATRCLNSRSLNSSVYVVHARYLN